MNLEYFLLIFFLIILSLFLYKKRKQIEVQKVLFPVVYFLMYKTKIGLKQMDLFAKKKRCVAIFGYLGIFIGFLGMIFISYELIRNVFTIFQTKQAVAGVGIVLPIEGKGIFYVPFFYWIISIFIVALVHEFAHGTVARRWGIKVKSSGIAFLSLIVPIIPAAFVEPDEKQLKKKGIIAQLSVFGAGPFINIILGIMIALILGFIIAPLANRMVDVNGVEIKELLKSENITFPAEQAGLESGEIILDVDGTKIDGIESFIRALEKKNPGENVNILTNKTLYNVTLTKNPTNESKGYLGVSVASKSEIKPELKEKYKFLPEVFMWFIGLLYWLYVLNLGIGLFNLSPLWIVDGGRMLQVVLEKYLGKVNGNKIWNAIGIVFLIVIFTIIISAFIL